MLFILMYASSFITYIQFNGNLLDFFIYARQSLCITNIKFADTVVQSSDTMTQIFQTSCPTLLHLVLVALVLWSTAGIM